MGFDLEGVTPARNSVDNHSLSGLISIRPETHGTPKNSNSEGTPVCVRMFRLDIRKSECSKNTIYIVNIVNIEEALGLIYS